MRFKVKFTRKEPAWEVRHGDCIEVMRKMPADSVDSIVTDPPYGLGFMGKDWDHGVPGKHFWQEALRVAKPGAWLLAFGGTRMFHRMTCAIEDAGWEIRDCVMWVYASGFPKSHNVAKAIHGHLVVGGSSPKMRRMAYMGDAYCEGETVGSSGTERAQERKSCAPPAGSGDNLVARAMTWQGWGTALKPAWEPVIVARKPLDGTVAQNVLKHGTGAINVDGCRVATDPADPVHSAVYHAKPSVAYGKFASKENREVRSMGPPSAGRWPANLIHDGSDEVVQLFPQALGQQGDLRGHTKERQSPNGCFGKMAPARDHIARGDSGSAARFFFCAKASRKDRNEGLDGLPEKDMYDRDDSKTNFRLQCFSKDGRAGEPRQNHHPTVKPTKLMRYLCRLVTPPKGKVLDPFCGSGSTGKAAVLEGFRFIGIDREAEYVEIARRRIAHAAD